MSTASPDLGSSARGMAIRSDPKGRRPETKTMRLARHGIPGSERPLVSGADGLWRALLWVAADIPPDLLDGHLSGLDLETLPVVDGIDRFGPPLTGIGK